MGALTMPVREKLDNLVFVINCNLQRLDGPVRGNGKIIQELEAAFLGAGWNVIKVLWGSRWDPLLARDQKGLLRRLMDECVDGEYQNFKAKGGAYTREHFFGKYPELRELVANMSDDEIWRLNRGGHDFVKVWNAYAAATATRGQPTVILAKTVKGFGLGKAGEGQKSTHQQKKLDDEALKAFRDRFNIPVSDDEIESLPFKRPAEDSEEMRYLRERARLARRLPARAALRGAAARRCRRSRPSSRCWTARGEREISTTMAFVRMLGVLLKDKNIGGTSCRSCPTRRAPSAWRACSARSASIRRSASCTRRRTRTSCCPIARTRRARSSRKGINEAGSMCSWIAAATAYSNHGTYMVPFYIYYSMFGFQRVGDFIWAAGDMRARGFLLGATAGRTTLAGEGLQHQDGHSAS